MSDVTPPPAAPAGSDRFSLSKADLSRVGKGVLLTALAAAATYGLKELEAVDLTNSTEGTLGVLLLLRTLLSAFTKWVAAPK
jgi:hypothetical protein